MVKCSCCGDEIPPSEEYYIRRKWEKRGWVFDRKCVVSGKARLWAEAKEKEAES